MALAVTGPHPARHAINGAAAAVVLIAAIAVLSRLFPDWLGPTDVERVFPSSAGRLHSPLNYWNALAALVAMGLPLLLSVTPSARTIAGRALATASLPLLVLCLFLAISRGGVIAAGAGLLAFLVLAPDRASRMATMVAAGAGSALLVGAADQRDALQDGLRTAAAHAQGKELLCSRSSYAPAPGCSARESRLLSCMPTARHGPDRRGSAGRPVGRSSWSSGRPCSWRLGRPARSATAGTSSRATARPRLRASSIRRTPSPASRH